MSAVTFAEEFTQLIISWTRPITTNGEAIDNIFVPLTSQQLLNSIQDVLQVMLGITLQVQDDSAVKTPAVGITVCTPNAPMVPKNLNQINDTLERYKSLDTFSSLSQENNLNGVAFKSQDISEPMDTDVLIPASEEKKFISRLSPAIIISSMTRSDTFMRKQENKDTLDGSSNRGEDDVITKLDAGISEGKIKSHTILKKIKALREYAFEFITKINDVEKEVHPQLTKPIRRLSSIGVFPGETRTSTLMSHRSVSSSKHRKSSTAFPGTPTSSKLNTLVAKKEEFSARRKSIAVVSMHTKSVSTPTMESKKSPSYSNKLTKNTKYAHVQTTIPKPAAIKKKSQ